MTDETLADKRRRQAKEAEQHGDLGIAWMCMDDANALDAKDARIAELERDKSNLQRKLYEARNYGFAQAKFAEGVVDAEAVIDEFNKLHFEFHALTLAVDTEFTVWGASNQLQGALMRAWSVLTTDHQGDENTTA